MCFTCFTCKNYFFPNQIFFDDIVIPQHFCFRYLRKDLGNTDAKYSVESSCLFIVRSREMSANEGFFQDRSWNRIFLYMWGRRCWVIWKKINLSNVDINLNRRHKTCFWQKPHFFKQNLFWDAALSGLFYQMGYNWHISWERPNKPLFNGGWGDDLPQ